MNTTAKLPLALKRTPLLEAVFELRFHPAVASAGDLLPGLLFQHFHAQYPTVEQLPLATIPREMRERDVNLQYQPTHRLVGTSSAIQIGERVVSLTVLYPYPGWGQFRGQVVGLLEVLGRTGVIRESERFAFRYINLIPQTGDSQLAMLAMHLEWPDHPITERGLHLRFERDVKEFVTIVQVTPGVTAKSGDRSVAGLLVDIDTIRGNVPAAFWNSDPSLLEDAHQLAKHTFYSLLTQATLESLGPIYDDTR